MSLLTLFRRSEAAAAESPAVPEGGSAAVNIDWTVASATDVDDHNIDFVAVTSYGGGYGSILVNFEAESTTDVDDHNLDLTISVI